MNAAVPSLPDATRRLQAAVALLALAGAVVATSVLVSTPATPGAASPGRPGGDAETALPPGLRVEVRGGEAWVAYRVADALAERGATVQGVHPAAPAANPVGTATTIVYYDRNDAASATLVRRILDRGWVRHEQVFHPGVDVTIVLGKEQPQA